jgi:hypothetical protein
MLEFARQAPLSNHGEKDIKDPHAIRQELNKMREASGSKTEVKRARMGPSRSAQIGQPNPLWASFTTPFDLALLQTIYSPRAKSHREKIRHSPPRSREERDTILERRELR